MFYLICLAGDEFSSTHHLKVAKGINENQPSLGAVGSISAYIPRGGAQQHRGPITIHGENEACAGWQWMKVPFWEYSQTAS